MKISFLIPCYNSEGSIQLVMDEIKSVMQQRKDMEFEIVAINDCSSDHVIDILCKYAQENEILTVLDLAKNVGRHGALMAGFHYATGDYIVTIDDDLQCPTDHLWELLAPLEMGEADVSIADFGRKQQTGLKNAGSWVNRHIARMLLGLRRDLALSSFAAVTKIVRDELIKYTNPYPYISGLYLRTTSKVVNVKMAQRQRTIGQGNYTFKKSFSLWLNVFTAFSVIPLRISTLIGCLCALCGFIFGVVTIVRKLLRPDILAGYSSLLATIFLLNGIILMILGLIGEYIGRIYISINNAPQFTVRKIIRKQSS